MINRKNPFEEESFGGGDLLAEAEEIYALQTDQIARLMYIYFDALTENGFTEEQALTIIIEHGPNAGGKHE